ncbi:DUF862-domain-containing protein [Jimgerdemannia flammicorona]|uniref:DUF862-domain-containing protein n=2 Tax=Jimgerdemannia flammicorona TaxID=994334 RepID=A0A433D8M5_9FUNG|nr:DUF862-domain-containing protein [Jimgerdemannia flammicorona]RUS31062.1 DUF862-domain-containing protein [Jimgerdemannia flammicorona]
MASLVKLFVYDLSQGMARQMSLGLTGRQIDGIWHTSVVVFGQEFYYGQGIFVSPPGTTVHGRPVETIDMGETHLPPEVFMEYIDNLRSTYTAEKYHLLDNNCNNFTNDVCQFLTGKSIPSHITSLPADFLNTPFGQTLRPMIESFFSPSAHAPTAASTTPFAPSPSSALPAVISASASPLQTATSLSALTHHLTTNRAAVVFFTSATCPPCRMIEPEYERLVTEKNDTMRGKGRVIGVKVDTGVAFDAASKYSVRATPTFKFFLDGKEFHEFKGANASELKSSLDFLVWTAYPPHPHTLIQSLRHIPSLSTAPILFSAIGNLDSLFGKLDSVAKDAGAEISPDERSVLDKVKALLVQKKEGKPPATDLNVDKWDATFARLLFILPLQNHFPLLDLLRLLLLEKRVAAFYSRNPDTIIEVLQRVNVTNDAPANVDGTQNNPPKSLVLMTLRVVCNTFSNPALPETHLLSPSPAAHRASLTALLVSSLLSTDATVRQTAASLAFNIAAWVAHGRTGENVGGASGTVATAAAWVEDEDWEIEVASAVVGAVETETEEEIVHRLVSTLAHLLYLVPQESALPNLVTVLGVPEIIEAKIKNGIVKGEKVKAVCGEVVVVLKKSLEAGEGK